MKQLINSGGGINLRTRLCMMRILIQKCKEYDMDQDARCNAIGLQLVMLCLQLQTYLRIRFPAGSNTVAVL